MTCKTTHINCCSSFIFEIRKSRNHVQFANKKILQSHPPTLLHYLFGNFISLFRNIVYFIWILLLVTRIFLFLKCVSFLIQVLCLHLKRFRWNNFFRTKLDNYINFPVQGLDMNKFILVNRVSDFLFKSFLTFKITS